MINEVFISSKQNLNHFHNISPPLFSNPKPPIRNIRDRLRLLNDYIKILSNQGFIINHNTTAMAARLYQYYTSIFINVYQESLKIAPVFFRTSSLTFFIKVSSSLSVKVAALGWKVTAIAIDFLP